jgi:hypothetical protein
MSIWWRLTRSLENLGSSPAHRFSLFKLNPIFLRSRLMYVYSEVFRFKPTSGSELVPPVTLDSLWSAIEEIGVTLSPEPPAFRQAEHTVPEGRLDNRPALQRRLRTILNRPRPGGPG